MLDAYAIGSAIPYLPVECYLLQIWYICNFLKARFLFPVWKSA